MFKTGEHFVCDFDEGFKISGSLVGSLSVEKMKFSLFALKDFSERQVQTKVPNCASTLSHCAGCRFTLFHVIISFKIARIFFIPAPFPPG